MRKMPPSHLRVEIVSADVIALLTELCNRGITLQQICNVDLLTATAIMDSSYYTEAEAYIQRRGGKIRITGQLGLLRRFVELKRRPILLIGIFAILFLTLWLPTRVLFLSVSGNERVPTKRILECAADCGIRFGVSRRSLRNEPIKNTLLDHLPELQWVGVNTQGCVALILVQERPEQKKAATAGSVGSIVAQRDGIITSCTATKGKLLCAPGQAVKQGDMLISAYADGEASLRYIGATGEIYAYTERQLRLILPANPRQQTTRNRQTEKVSLIFGKKRINLYNRSGNLGSICDRMYVTKYIKLPGGFQLPFGITIEWIGASSAPDPEVASDILEQAAMDAADAYLERQMISGQIQHSVVHMDMDGEALYLAGRYVCIEMIGIIKKEEILNGYG